MLKFFHKYQKSILGLIIGAGVCISMLGFGVDVGGGNQRDIYAIKVNDREISFDDFYNRKRQVEERYRQFFGDRYWSLAPQLLKDLSQNLTDGIVDEMLVLEDASSKQLHVGDEEVRQILLSQVFPQGFNAAQYAAMLQNMNMSSARFEKQLAQDALQNQYRNILEDVSFSSNLEARELLLREKTEYDLKYVELDPASLLKKVAEPDEELLKVYYEENATDFETQPQVAYQFIVFDPASNLDLVEVTEDDIEFFYSENQRDFRTPEKIKARMIRLNYPVESDPQKIAEVRAKAEEVHAKAQAGEDFSALVTQYSDDVASKLSAGDLGWVLRGSRSKEFDEAAFQLKQAGLAPLVETDSGFEIVQIDEYQESGQKELAEVRDEIVTRIKRRESPAFTAAKAEELLESWNVSAGKSLEEFATERGLTLELSQGLKSRDQDPTGYSGLTARVLELGADARAVVDLKEKSILVSVSEFQGVRIPDFEEVRDQILAKVKVRESEKLALELAKTLLADVEKAELSDFAELVKKAGLELKESAKVSLASAATAPFSNPEVRSEIQSVSKTPSLPKQKYLVDGKYYLVQVQAIHQPDEAAINSEIAQYKERADKMLAQNLFQSILNDLKFRSKVDINPSLLAN